MEIIKMVITGGPCAGKSTAMSRIQNTLANMGYKALFIGETATELITGGVAPWTCGTNAQYQSFQMKLQIEKEKIFEQAALTMNADKVLIICDRGVMHNKAYMQKEEFEQVLKEINANEVELRDGYDAVFHLVTAAKGAEQFYTTINNTARTETPEQAILLDDKIISAWTGHPHFRIIDNSYDFETKIRKLITEILGFLGEPEPLEIERKYLIEYPDLNMLENMDNCEKVEIIQTYLHSPEQNQQIRLRQRGFDGHYVYFQTIKKDITPVKRIEIENRLTKDEYLRLLMSADTSKRQIRKNRYCLTYKNQYFEIDVFPFWKDKALMEIELSDEDSPIVFPDFIKIIREVTTESEYKNSSLAQQII